MDDFISAADALHEHAASLNQRGEFEAAKSAYADYRRALASCEEMSATTSLPDATVHARLWALANRAPRIHRLVALDAPVRARARAAILGAAAADAAAMPLHWVYDVRALRKRVDAHGGDPAFLSPPADAFYSYALGRATPYGEQATALLQSLAHGEHDGWSAELYAAQNFDAFSAAFDGYRDTSTRGFLRVTRAGALPPATGVDDDQANAYARLPPLVGSLAGDPAMLPAVRAMVRTTQRSAAAISCALVAARLLEFLILGSAATVADAVVAAAVAAEDAGDDEAVGAAALRASLAHAHETHEVAVTAFGRSCHLPGSLSSAVHALLAYGGDYAESVKGTIMQGGCNASRAGFIGACLAAMHGEEAIPPTWRTSCSAYAEIGRLADAALSVATSGSA